MMANLKFFVPSTPMLEKSSLKFWLETEEKLKFCYSHLHYR